MWWSEEIYRIFGLKPEDFGASYESFLDSVHPDDRESVINSIDEALNEGMPYSIDHRIVLPDGDVRIVHEHANVSYDENDRPIYMIGTVQDITEERLAQEEKSRLEAQLHHSHKMDAIGKLAGGIAHDFNNILQVILCDSQALLHKKTQDDPDHGKLREIEQSVYMAADLTRSLLIFSRKLEGDFGPVNLNQAVEQVCKMLKRTIPKMIEIKVELQEDLDAINAVSSQIVQVLMNLGINARDAMPDRGSLVIRTQNLNLDEDFCRMHVKASPGEHVMLSVSDTGHGMGKETLEHMYEPFYSTKEQGEGSGLGLAMVYGIVESHNGFITCCSDPGRGTTFIIYFPAYGIESIEEEEERETENIPGGRETVLLVDDEDKILNLVSKIMEHYGYTTIMADCGESAIEIFRREKDLIDLVIMDLGMPGMGGQKALEELKGIDPSLKIIIASGYLVNRQLQKWIKSSASGFIAKPYRFKDILKKIRAVMDTAASTAAARIDSNYERGTPATTDVEVRRTPPQ